MANSPIPDTQSTPTVSAVSQATRSPTYGRESGTPDTRTSEAESDTRHATESAVGDESAPQSPGQTVPRDPGAVAQRRLREAPSTLISGELQRIVPSERNGSIAETSSGRIEKAAAVDVQVIIRAAGKRLTAAPSKRKVIRHPRRHGIAGQIPEIETVRIVRRSPASMLRDET